MQFEENLLDCVFCLAYVSNDSPGRTEDSPRMTFMKNCQGIITTITYFASQFFIVPTTQFRCSLEMERSPVSVDRSVLVIHSLSVPGQISALLHSIIRCSK